MYFGLNEPEVIENTKEIEKVFDYEEDIEEVGEKLDKKNREKFSKEDFDSIFIASTESLEDINILRQNEDADFEKRINASEDFDIFGSMLEDRTKINNLGSHKHREIKKSKFRLLDITKNTTNEQYINRLQEITKSLDKAIEKAEFGFDLNAFYASTAQLNNKEYDILSINPKNALEDLKDCDKINLYNIKLNKKTKAIALTNIVYFDNNNQTLPLGMNVSDKILVDMSKLKLELKKQKLFRINQEIDELNAKTKIICVYEYEDIKD